MVYPAAMGLNVRIDRTLPSIDSDAVNFETGLTRVQLENSSIVAYEHHGPEFSPTDRGALVALFEDLVLGRPLPQTFNVRRIQDIDTLVAIALFLHRDLLQLSSTAPFVQCVDFVHRFGLPALAQVSEELGRFLSALRSYVPDSGLGQADMGERVTTVVSCICDYLRDGYATFSSHAPTPNVRVLDHGTDGFVVAASGHNLWDSWVELFRQGYSRGVLVSTGSERTSVLAARKSCYVALDLAKACAILNEMERAMGEPAEWSVTPDGLWLMHRSGTILLLKAITEILVRV